MKNIIDRYDQEPDTGCKCRCHSDETAFRGAQHTCCFSCPQCGLEKVIGDSVSHEAVCGRIIALRSQFYQHESVTYTGVLLTDLRDGYARVRVLARPEFLVRCDMEPGKIVQGGFIAGVIPNFAGVYAAMTLTEGHAALIAITNFSLVEKVVERETIIAEARAYRVNDRTISVRCEVKNDEGVTKAYGVMLYKERKKPLDSMPSCVTPYCE